MNRVIIVGNGFDLAHNLKTRYSDFIYSYYIGCMENVSKNGFHEDPLWLIQATNSTTIPTAFLLSEKLPFQQILERTKQIGYKYTFRSSFFETICTNVIDKMWVDIEHIYYIFLRNCLKTGHHEVELINRQLDFIKTKLIEYTKIQSQNFDATPKISAKISALFTYNLRNQWEMPAMSKLTSPGAVDKVFILNFNYTDTISSYLKSIKSSQLEEIQIHGNIYRPESIIFGFGDELDKDYLEIENLNQNEFFAHIKSFKYFQDNKYQHLIQSLNNDYFEVYVMGHSLGVSDRTMFNQIFESSKLTSVKLFYYVKEDGTNDFVEKTYEISRHFKDKGRMRMKVVPFSESTFHPQSNSGD